MRTRALTLLGLLLGACQMAGPPGPETVGPGLAPVVVSEGPISSADQAEAARAYRSAEISFEARRYLEALGDVQAVLERYPASNVSGAALLLGARAELGARAVERADAAAERYVELLEPGDPRATEARLIQVEAMAGRPAEQLDRLLRIDVTATADELGVAVPAARAAVDALQPEELAAVLEAAPTNGPLAPVAQVRRAAYLSAEGDQAGAVLLAQSVLDSGADAPERELAERVLSGELVGSAMGGGMYEIATVLPHGGPPALSEFAQLVAEGIEVAATMVLGDRYQITVTPYDDEGDPVVAAGIVPELEAAGFAGAIGFLEDRALVEAALARVTDLPLISPTARTAEEAGEGVYSLEGPDIEGAAAIARYAASRAFQRVAIVLPESAPAAEEADAFTSEAERLGISVVGRFPYVAGETFFESQIIGARNALRASEVAALGLGEEDSLRVEVLEPVGIFLPIPPEDVEFLAPQIAHFALDTLAIELVGTAGWGDAQILESLEPRYTHGVVATAPSGAAQDSPGQLRFREAYEAHFQRTLVNAAPAIGYDAALLLLEAIRSLEIADAPELLNVFEPIREVEGATGIFSIVDGRVVRRTVPVRIRDGALVPIAVD